MDAQIKMTGIKMPYFMNSYPRTIFVHESIIMKNPWNKNHRLLLLFLMQRSILEGWASGRRRIKADNVAGLRGMLRIGNNAENQARLCRDRIGFPSLGHTPAN